MPCLDIPVPQLQPFARAVVQVAPALEVGPVPLGVRRVIPIVGGYLEGDGWTAQVLPGGADFQLIANERMALLDARYTLQTDAGDLIFVVNRAVRTAPPEITARLLRGEPVDARQVYFRCCPQFETSSAALGWINERVFVGAGVRLPDQVQMAFYEVA